MTEATAWVKKYLIAVSVDLKLRSLKIKGINLIRLISRPIQQRIHELDDTAIKVPKNVVVINVN